MSSSIRSTILLFLFFLATAVSIEIPLSNDDLDNIIETATTTYPTTTTTTIISTTPASTAAATTTTAPSLPPLKGRLMERALPLIAHPLALILHIVIIVGCLKSARLQAGFKCFVISQCMCNLLLSVCLLMTALTDVFPDRFENPAASRLVDSVALITNVATMAQSTTLFATVFYLVAIALSDRPAQVRSFSLVFFACLLCYLVVLPFEPTITAVIFNAPPNWQFHTRFLAFYAGFFLLSILLGFFLFGILLIHLCHAKSRALRSRYAGIESACVAALIVPLLTFFDKLPTNFFPLLSAYFPQSVDHLNETLMKHATYFRELHQELTTIYTAIVVLAAIVVCNYFVRVLRADPDPLLLVKPKNFAAGDGPDGLMKRD